LGDISRPLYGDIGSDFFEWRTGSFTVSQGKSIEDEKKCNTMERPKRAITVLRRW
jgi:hypothetical protein